MSRVTLQLDKCLEKLKICKKKKKHLQNCFEKRFVLRGSSSLGICTSRAFLHSYEITDFKTNERQAIIIQLEIILRKG